MKRSAILPPLASLRAFEAVGRLRSFSRAGEELLITQSAVSHHIKQLEQHLGTRLFQRNGRAIALTVAGSAFHMRVAEAFALIGKGTEELRMASGRVRASMLPSFAAHWLLPRLHDFHATYPGIPVDVDATLKMVDVEADEADLAIRYGSGSWPGVRAEHLMDETLTPVLSPKLAKLGPSISTPADLLRHTLLVTERSLDWDTWLERHGLFLRDHQRMQLVDYNVAVTAAIEGAGIALGRMTLIEHEIDSGTLIAPLAQVSAPDRASYWFVTPTARPLSQAATVFRDWLKKEIANP